jgi:hypothetical protein
MAPRDRRVNFQFTILNFQIIFKDQIYKLFGKLIKFMENFEPKIEAKTEKQRLDEIIQSFGKKVISSNDQFMRWIPITDQQDDEARACFVEFDSLESAKEAEFALKESGFEVDFLAEESKEINDESKKNVVLRIDYTV